jgi:hypothetical protein
MSSVAIRPAVAIVVRACSTHGVWSGHPEMCRSEERVPGGASRPSRYWVTSSAGSRHVGSGRARWSRVVVRERLAQLRARAMQCSRGSSSIAIAFTAAVLVAVLTLLTGSGALAERARPRARTRSG